MEDLGPEQWRKAVADDDQAVIVDVRTPGEWMEGIIPDAECQDMFDGPAFREFIQNLDQDKHYYVYCRSGNRSGQACRFMASHGITCFNLKGGIMGWNGDIVPPRGL